MVMRGAKTVFINIYSKGRYPADALSNFAPHRFDFDGFDNIPCMEAFLQSLKCSDPVQQRQMLYLCAKEAKERGGNIEWNGVLTWKGQLIDRFSKDYTALVERAYRALLANDDFRRALAASKGKILLHTIGKTRRSQTVLTWWEFVGVLHKLRKELN